MNPCTICGFVLHGARALWTTCQACHDRILARLDAIEEIWPRLSAALEPGRALGGQRVSGSPEPVLPLNGRILALIGPMGVPNTLYLRYADLTLARGISPASRPPGEDARLALALWGIRKHLPWAVQGTDLTELHRTAGRLADELRTVTADADTPNVPCPAELADGSRCTGRMRYDRGRNTASCRTCRTELAPGEWLDVWVRLGQPAA
ncbi:hypothetical protein [Streptomyces prasinopilosus]|uniref:hypothetical protein n=1 Tax=Streptomyces prasinopilosus TaxID=67344 RepID=UPI0006EB6EE7|nr:hypothetical protein [Streptomyces prasinopilosus]